jgi:hypothetical protein
LKGAWIQTLNPGYQSWFLNVPFQLNLRHYNVEVEEEKKEKESQRAQAADRAMMMEVGVAPLFTSFCIQTSMVM